MKIDSNSLEVFSQRELERASRARESAHESQVESDQDVARLSNTADRLHALAATVASMPELRSEKIDSLRRAIADGTYEPKAEDVAKAIIRDTNVPKG